MVPQFWRKINRLMTPILSCDMPQDIENFLKAMLWLFSETEHPDSSIWYQEVVWIYKFRNRSLLHCKDTKRSWNHRDKPCNRIFWFRMLIKLHKDGKCPHSIDKSIYQEEIERMIEEYPHNQTQERNSKKYPLHTIHLGISIAESKTDDNKLIDRICERCNDGTHRPEIITTHKDTESCNLIQEPPYYIWLRLPLDNGIHISKRRYKHQHSRNDGKYIIPAECDIEMEFVHRNNWG